MKKYVYFFDEGNKDMKKLLGGKGANLAEMTKMGIPVPKGFTITSEACIEYTNDNKFPEGLLEQIDKNLKTLEKNAGKIFGDPENPLLVSVRSGAAISMPGMMDTILNLGLNENTIQGIISKTKDERFAYDSYRRFIQMFGNVVMGIKSEFFEEILEMIKEKQKVEIDADIDTEGLKEIVRKYKELVKKETGREFPDNPKQQLNMAIEAVFSSWDNKRAITYRKINKIPDDLGTAVNVQEMVFGNMGYDSGTGVGFTRNPSTGEKENYGEYLLNAQGEDVVAGIRTPKHLDELKNDMPKVYDELIKTVKILENNYKDVQDYEFTIEKNKLYLLQTRTGKRTTQAALKIAVDMVKEGIINKETAVMRIEPIQLNQLLHRRIDPEADITVIAKGLPASPGAASGKVVFTADEAEEMGGNGEDVILVRTETTPDDIHGMVASKGTLTSRGGMTSHAAVVARGMGMPCVAGCSDIAINSGKGIFTIKNDQVVKKGEYITIDGGTGNVYKGKVPMIEPKMSEEFKLLLSWADEIRKLGVYANADTPEDAQKARDLGAEGIGLCRTEHMFMAPERLPIVQAMIISDTKKARQEQLDKLLPMQKSDFLGILKAMQGLPVIIRLLDPPLHEFLPNFEETLVNVTKLRLEKPQNKAELDKQEKILERIRMLQEMNPMLGLRGCRLGLLYPEIYEMQVRAIIEASVELQDNGINIKPEIMIPLIGHINELKPIYNKTKQIAEKIIKDKNVKLEYKVGTMIELPRAALTADEIAEYAEFFSFGTNDLTQTTFGISRDDAEGKFLLKYVEEGILKENPFEVLDVDGVGKLVRTGTELGRKTRPDLEVGICGEHGGEPSSVEFCHKVGLNYVSCSTFRVPIARLSAAHAVLKE
ncbi:MAG: pyruvate, phosphate dikinase [Candidatus Caldatribacteriota bacterium]|nr:pyruvate, phosphate dikinase [Atribacterota bacterium]MDD3640174.1 pyruvate, phosphate dikinase [Atribacterota bacterium]MDD4288286.1 pyruvate, phosphate dikinase [Atribacterota bacterium]MDD5635110.1 pyruvate, phosphate dikinase [Atribacterota bacterium]MDI9596445.1 pyruvate, phosphate dikinase [Atribacterota bacterium]